jgi:hypothetical protein
VLALAWDLFPGWISLAVASLSSYFCIFTNSQVALPLGLMWCFCASLFAGFGEDQIIKRFIMIKMMNNSYGFSHRYL